jgi:hypothetical protein
MLPPVFFATAHAVSFSLTRFERFCQFSFPQIFLILTNRPHGPRVSCPLSQAVGWFLAGFPEQVETAVAETGFDPTTWRFGYHLPYHFPVST